MSLAPLEPRPEVGTQSLYQTTQLKDCLAEEQKIETRRESRLTRLRRLKNNRVAKVTKKLNGSTLNGTSNG